MLKTHFVLDKGYTLIYALEQAEKAIFKQNYFDGADFKGAVLLVNANYLKRGKNPLSKAKNLYGVVKYEQENNMELPKGSIYPNTWAQWKSGFTKSLNKNKDKGEAEFGRYTKAVDPRYAG